MSAYKRPKQKKQIDPAVLRAFETAMDLSGSTQTYRGGMLSWGQK